MDLHGGQLSLHSKGVGFGSTFTVKLNLYEGGGAMDVPTSTALNDNLLHISPSTALLCDITLDTALTNSEVTPHLTNEDEEMQEVVRDVVCNPRMSRRMSSIHNYYHRIAATADDTSSAFIFENLHFLVVDDSRMNRKMLVKLLVSEKHTCDQAEDGEVAVKMVMGAKERCEANQVGSE